MNLKYKKNGETDFEGKKSMEHLYPKLSINGESKCYYKKYAEDTPLLQPSILHRVTTLFLYEELLSLSRNATGVYVLNAMQNIYRPVSHKIPLLNLKYSVQPQTEYQSSENDKIYWSSNV